MFEGTQNGPRYKLQALYSLLSSHIECEVTKVNRNDQGYRGYLDNLEAGNLLIFDLGYFCIASFKEITGKSSYFVSRVYSLRWQVELLFKVMKSKLSMDEIKDINPNKVQLIIYSKLILLIIALVLLRSFQQTEISLFKAIDYYKEKFEVILEELIKGKWHKIKHCLLQIERFAKKSSRKNRLSSKQLCGFYTFFSSA
jgi:IS4 transposase